MIAVVWRRGAVTKAPECDLRGGGGWAGGQGPRALKSAERLKFNLNDL
jgi:hypothetical protein